MARKMPASFPNNFPIEPPALPIENPGELLSKSVFSLKFVWHLIGYGFTRFDTAVSIGIIRQPLLAKGAKAAGLNVIAFLSMSGHAKQLSS